MKTVREKNGCAKYATKVYKTNRKNIKSKEDEEAKQEKLVPLPIFASPIRSDLPSPFDSASTPLSAPPPLPTDFSDRQLTSSRKM
jgi:hypothetical protein